MRAALLSHFVVLGAAIFIMLLESTAVEAAGPPRLTESQMDAVAAGTAGVSIDSMAVAVGDAIYTSTKTSTRAISTPGGVVELALGWGKAFACCGSNTAATVSAEGYGDGVHLIGHNTVVEPPTPLFSIAIGTASVISVNPRSGR